MLNKPLFTLLFISALLFQGCSNDNTKNSTDTEKSAHTKNKNEYILTSTNNQHYTVEKTKDGGFILKDAKDKIVIFDIFATWCPPCQASAVHLSSIQKKFKRDVVVIGLTIEDGIPNEKIKQFKNKFHANYAIANSPENRRLITEIADQLDVGERFPIPLMVIYKDGKIVNHYIGAVEEEFVESDIKQALGK